MAFYVGGGRGVGGPCGSPGNGLGSLWVHRDHLGPTGAIQRVFQVALGSLWVHRDHLGPIGAIQRVF